MRNPSASMILGYRINKTSRVIKVPMIVKDAAEPCFFFTTSTILMYWTLLSIKRPKTKVTLGRHVATA